MKKWQQVSENTSQSSQTLRMPVPGGWLYRWEEYDPEGEGITVSSMVFVPDPQQPAQLANKLDIAIKALEIYASPQYWIPGSSNQKLHDFPKLVVSGQEENPWGIAEQAMEDILG